MRIITIFNYAGRGKMMVCANATSARLGATGIVVLVLSLGAAHAQSTSASPQPYDDTISVESAAEQTDESPL
ncbi:MAG: hypothetical protein C9356_19855, partial [Oleiphilus sp.]